MTTTNTPADGHARVDVEERYENDEIRVIFGAVQGNGQTPAEVHFIEGLLRGWKLTGFTVRLGPEPPGQTVQRLPDAIVELPQQLANGQRVVSFDAVRPDYQHTPADGGSMFDAGAGAMSVGSEAEYVRANSEGLRGVVSDAYIEMKRGG